MFMYVSVVFFIINPVCSSLDQAFNLFWTGLSILGNLQVLAFLIKQINSMKNWLFISWWAHMGVSPLNVNNRTEVFLI